MLKQIAAIRESSQSKEACAGERLAPPVCICNRQLQDILCRSCGYIFVGRVRKRCRYHPTEILLMDMTCCPKCKSTHMLEIQGTQQSAKMEKADMVQVKQGDSSPNSTTSAIQSPTERKQNEKVKEQSTSPFILSGSSSTSRQNSQQDSKGNKDAGNAVQNSARKAILAEPKLKFLNIRTPESVKRTITFDTPKTEGQKSAGGGSVDFEQKKTSSENVSSNNCKTAPKPKYVDSECQTDFNVQVIDDCNQVMYQSPVRVNSGIQVSAMSGQRGAGGQVANGSCEHVAGGQGVNGADGQVVNGTGGQGFMARSQGSEVKTPTKTSKLPPGSPCANLPVVSDQGAGDMYYYNPRRAVGERNDTCSMLLQVIQESHMRPNDTNFNDLGSKSMRKF